MNDATNTICVFHLSQVFLLLMLMLLKMITLLPLIMFRYKELRVTNTLGLSFVQMVIFYSIWMRRLEKLRNCNIFY